MLRSPVNDRRTAVVVTSRARAGWERAFQGGTAGVTRVSENGTMGVEDCMEDCN